MPRNAVQLVLSCLLRFDAAPGTFWLVLRTGRANDRSLLTVGALETRKNQRTAIEAFERCGIARRGGKLHTLRRKRRRWAEEIEASAARTPGAKVLGYVSECTASLAIPGGERVCTAEPARRLRNAST